MELKKEIYINNKLNKILSERLIGFELVDNSGVSLDSLKLSINNSDKVLEIPSKNVLIELAIGFGGRAYKMGAFVVQYVSSDETILSIDALSQDLSKGRIRHSRIFKEKTLEAILKTLASDLGVSLKIDSSFMGNKIAYYLQDNKTSLEVLYELSEIYYAIATIKNNELLFISKNNPKKIMVNEADILSINKEDNNAKVYKGVSYHCWNMKQAKLEIKKAGKEPYLFLNGVVDPSIADLYVDSKYKEIKDYQIVNIKMRCNPQLQVGGVFEVIGLSYPLFRGIYKIEKIIHKYDNSCISEVVAVKLN